MSPGAALTSLGVNARDLFLFVDPTTIVMTLPAPAPALGVPVDDGTAFDVAAAAVLLAPLAVAPPAALLAPAPPLSCHPAAARADYTWC